jgi:16S rRNA (uracil1498-N3)-methyltransferase
MRQLLLPGALAAGRQVELAGEDYHYLSRVLRKVPGDRLTAIDEVGRRWSVAVIADDGSRLTLLVETEVAPADRFPRVTLYQAIPKGRKLDDVVRQLVQFGVHRICPLVTERTIVRPDEGSGRVERWRRIAREAVQQSGAGTPAEVLPPRDIGELRAQPGALSLVLHTEPLAQTSLHGYLGRIPDEVELVVGPEGGFAGTEISRLREAGFEPLWLGPQVLRSESAALFAAAAIRLLIVEYAHWQPAGP